MWTELQKLSTMAKIFAKQIFSGALIRNISLIGTVPPPFKITNQKNSMLSTPSIKSLKVNFHVFFIETRFIYGNIFHRN